MFRIFKKRDMKRIERVRFGPAGGDQQDAHSDKPPGAARRSLQHVPSLIMRGHLLLWTISLLLLFNAWVFRDDLMNASMRTVRVLQDVTCPAEDRALGYKAYTASREYSKRDKLSPALKRAIVDYVELLLSRTAIEEHALAPIAPQRDFALKADGASIVCELTTGCSWWHVYIPGTGSSADYAIDDSHAIGHCWSLASRAGQLGILLAEPLYPTSVTIDYILPALAADSGQAPRKMVLWGLLDGEENAKRFEKLELGSAIRAGPPVSDGYTFAPLAMIEFDIAAPFHVQSFPVTAAIVDSKIDFTIVVLEILENWGSTSTCLYRVRIHGETAVL